MEHRHDKESFPDDSSSNEVSVMKSQSLVKVEETTTRLNNKTETSESNEAKDNIDESMVKDAATSNEITTQYQFEALLHQASNYKPPSPPLPTQSSISVIPTDLWIKLFAYSALLLILPPLMFFAGHYYFFPGHLVASAMVSIVIAKFVVASFIYAAFTEDAGKKKKVE